MAEERNFNLLDSQKLLKESSSQMRWAHGRISELETKLASYERFDHALKIAQSTPDHMRQGLDVVDFATKLAHSSEDLHVWQKAAEMQAAQPKLASLADDSTSFVEVDNPRQIPEGQAAQAMQQWLLQGYSGQQGF